MYMSAGQESDGACELGETLAAIVRRDISVLFISPERLLAPSFQRFASNKQLFPPVHCLCIDEGK